MSLIQSATPQIILKFKIISGGFFRTMRYGIDVGGAREHGDGLRSGSDGRRFSGRLCDVPRHQWHLWVRALHAPANPFVSLPTPPLIVFWQNLFLFGFSETAGKHYHNHKKMGSVCRKANNYGLWASFICNLIYFNFYELLSLAIWIPHRMLQDISFEFDTLCADYKELVC